MTTLEYARRQLTKHRRSMAHAMAKPNAGDEVQALLEKVRHYTEIVQALEEVAAAE